MALHQRWHGYDAGYLVAGAGIMEGRNGGGGAVEVRDVGVEVEVEVGAEGCFEVEVEVEVEGVDASWHGRECPGNRYLLPCLMLGRHYVYVVVVVASCRVPRLDPYGPYECVLHCCPVGPEPEVCYGMMG